LDCLVLCSWRLSAYSKATVKRQKEYAWIDGLCNCLLHGHSSQGDDNTYDKEVEKAACLEYEAGAKAAEEFVKYLDKAEQMLT
jgi:hypothetical protein